MSAWLPIDQGHCGFVTLGHLQHIWENFLNSRIKKTIFQWPTVLALVKSPYFFGPSQKVKVPPDTFPATSVFIKLIIYFAVIPKNG